jgi:hypothetical protein
MNRYLFSFFYPYFLSKDATTETYFISDARAEINAYMIFRNRIEILSDVSLLIFNF